MANHKSALKRIKENEAQAVRNRVHRSRLRNQIRKLRVALEGKDKAGATALLASTLSLIDHSTHTGVLHPNTAARYKSRLTVQFNSLA